MDHNLEAIDLEEPLDESQLDVLIQEQNGEQYIHGIYSASVCKNKQT